jgi:hypothetical protein
MRLTITTFLFLFSISKLFSQDTSQSIITYDVDNFWTAYDKIKSTKDSAKQYEYIDKLFISKGSPGLKAIMQAREYTDTDYINAINKYPLFWNSVRQNTFNAKQFANDIEMDINKIKKIYPDLKPAKIYFTIGALRTGGTTLNKMVLIGSEIAMADSNTIATEFPNEFRNLKTYFATNPINKVAFGNTHEYIHTQQRTTIGDNLLAQSVIEGVAEFITVLGTEKKSSAPAIEYGYKNIYLLREKFAIQMFNSFTGFWLYSNAENEFNNVRDLGYYIGYAICEKYYNRAKDKKQAIKQMIELDYNNEIALKKFVDKSKYFSQSIVQYKKQFNNDQPVVVNILQFKNGDNMVNPNIKEMTIEFSKPMNDRYRSFELGALGEKNLLPIKKFISFSDDKKSVTFEIALKPNQHYQIIVGSGFRSKELYALSLNPYLIDITTTVK